MLVAFASGTQLGFVQAMAAKKKLASNAMANADQSLQRDTQDNIKIANDAIADAVKTRSDTVTNAMYAYLGQVVSTVSSMFQIKDAAQESFDQFRNGLLVGLEAVKESLTHSMNLTVIALKADAGHTLAKLDDPVILAAIAVTSKTLANLGWQLVAAELPIPLSGSRNRGPSTATFQGFPPMVLVLDQPLRPGSQPTTTHSSEPIDPAIFDEPEIGFVNGLKTGLKALVNATADTGKGLISLGQWEPEDVWQVNRMTDVGYDGALVAAKIATAAASAAATGGLAGGVGKVGQVARVVDRVDALGNVLVGVQGAANIVAVGNVNLQNGMQVVGGVLGGAQLKAAQNAPKVVAKADEAVVVAAGPGAGDINKKLAANMQVHPDLPIRGKDDPTNGILFDMECKIRGKVVSGGTRHEAFDARWKSLSEEATVAARHAEGHAIGKMLELNLKEAVLFINYGKGPCKTYCQKALKELMNEGMKLTIYYPEGYGVLTKAGWERIFA